MSGRNRGGGGQKDRGRNRDRGLRRNEHWEVMGLTYCLLPISWTMLVNDVRFNDVSWLKEVSFLFFGISEISKFLLFFFH